MRGSFNKSPSTCLGWSTTTTVQRVLMYCNPFGMAHFNPQSMVWSLLDAVKPQRDNSEIQYHPSFTPWSTLWLGWFCYRSIVYRKIEFRILWLSVEVANFLPPMSLD
mmetsp:Transcript_18944/g.51913  ORF Transcript_18944/g.51913 Transcript_18944/m.51913 type:complete len:107 (+) Transcript_18944:1619-1939(+)